MHIFGGVCACVCVRGYVLGYELVHMYPGQHRHSTQQIRLSQQARALLRIPQLSGQPAAHIYRHGTNTDRSIECQGLGLVCAVSYSYSE